MPFKKTGKPHKIKKMRKEDVKKLGIGLVKKKEDYSVKKITDDKKKEDKIKKEKK